MKKIAFLCPYFGKFPKHFDLFLKSCEANKDCTWFIFTDDKSKHTYPKNVIVEYCSLQDLQKRFSNKLGFDAHLPNIPKLGEYKPTLGFMFEELIKDFKAWAHLDLNDSIWGMVSDFISNDMLDEYDKIGVFGHMSIYKNTYENNRTFMKPLKNGMDYKKIFSTDRFLYFEEIQKNSITDIFIEQNKKIKNMSNHYADICISNYDFRYRLLKDNFKQVYKSKDKNMIFAWENGKLYRYMIINDKIDKTEFLYIHMKKRKLNISNDFDFKADKYIIYQDGFMPFENITKEFIKAHNKKKIIYKKFYEYKYNNIKARIRRKKMLLLEKRNKSEK